MKSFVIAAPRSGSGKTTVTLGIMECLRRRGLTVAPFKVGPDFIDPGYHRLVCGRPSINLDGWICSPQFVQETFAIHGADADVAVIEGVMGLFDGFGGASDEGSTAQAARLTRSPVVLVVDAKGLARSGAALVKGFADFDPELAVSGVIFNNVASSGHGLILREAMESSCPSVKVVGCIPRDERLSIASRHLGLVTADENPLSPPFLDALAEVTEEYLDVDLLLSLAAEQTGLSGRAESPEGKPLARIAVARDEAFCFVYEDNLRLLREAGAEITEFSPLRDWEIPSCDGIYLPGGYPELFADRLAANTGMKRSLRAAMEKGMPVYAECGGFIYLSRGVVSDGTFAISEFTGTFPVATSMLPRRKALGYREVMLERDTPIGPQGLAARGHEFHYSEMEPMPESVARCYRVRRRGGEGEPEGYLSGSCLASYIHLHFGSCPEIATNFVAACRKFAMHDLRVF